MKNERVLVVKAETGSGKTTQLPQYAAEFFCGQVICTQPRVIAAISLARRVADEYDGTSVGHSVGYRVSHANVGKDKNRAAGTDILYMTDGTFVQESQINPHLNGVRVLIIDEAHERSLNTDIVMGIAKQLLSTRLEDFYVVISSATINTDKFLKFFERIDFRPLEVKGRVYPVKVEHISIANEHLSKRKESIEERAVSMILKLYDQREGNILVFLPGQNQIKNAMELFTRKIPDNCIPLPLYSALSSEEQDLVLKFNEDGGSEK